MCLGRRPMPIGAENARSTIQEVRKVALGPSAADGRPHTFACCALQPFSCFPSFFRELPLLTRPHLAQPLPASADPAGSKLFWSPLGVTVAASLLAAACETSAKGRVRLAPGSIPAHADPCEDYINIGMANNAVKVRLTYTTAAYSTPSRICRARH